MNAQKEIQSELKNVKLNTFVATGSNDLICCPSGSYMAGGEIPKNTLKIYPDAYHQLHADLEETTTEFFGDLSKWIQDQLRIKDRVEKTEPN